VRTASQLIPGVGPTPSGNRVTRTAWGRDQVMTELYVD
jgi:hypothetical protein